MAEEKPADDEQYCPSCGEIILRAAEICPKCGVRVEKTPLQGTSQ